MIKKFTLLFLNENLKLYLTLLFLLLTYWISLFLYKIPLQVIFYPSFIFLIFFLFYEFFSYLNEYKQFKELNQIEEQNSLFHFVSQDNSDLNSSFNTYKFNKILNYLKNELKNQEIEFQNNNQIMEEIISTWIHQIKIPITSMKLILDQEDNSISRELQIDLHRIELYIEMILSYYRLKSPSTDYLIKNINLEELLKTEIKKFSTEFIKRKIHLDLISQPINYLTDEKWLAIVFDQLISNALKYTPENGNISIKLEPNNILINDSGIGIAENDLPRIFERGYTGFNGRLNKKSSGLGLYLTKEICENLNIPISIESKLNEGTNVKLKLYEDNLIVE